MQFEIIGYTEPKYTKMPHYLSFTTPEKSVAIAKLNKLNLNIVCIFRRNGKLYFVNLQRNYS